MNSKKCEKLTRILIPLFLFAAGLGAAIGFGFWQKIPEDEMIRNGVVMAFAGFVLSTGLITSMGKETLLFDNHAHLVRFVIVYVFGLCMVPACFYLPAKLWPILVLAVALSLTSNTVVGMSAYITIMLLIALLSNGQAHVFYANILIGMTAITLFHNIDYEFHYRGALVVSSITLLVTENAFYLLFENTRPSPDQYVLPLVNVCISCILLLVGLKYYSKKIVHRYRDIYQKINDPEYVLLAELKKRDPKAYFQAVHTAHFCDKIAHRIGADVYLCKALGYYQRMEVFLPKDSELTPAQFAKEHHFPPQLTDALEEMRQKQLILRRKETAVAYFADTVVSSIRYIFQRDKDAVLDYHQVIPMIFKRKLDGGILLESELTMGELEIMKKLFIEENLYYDFLR